LEPEAYRSNMYPNILVVGPKWKETVFLEGFTPFANVFYIQQDTFSNLVGAAKRSLLTTRLVSMPVFLRKLIVYLSTFKLPLREYSKWRWQIKYLRRTGLDGIIIIPHAIPPRRPSGEFRDAQVFLVTSDVESERFYQAYLWVAKAGLVDRVYVRHRVQVDLFKGKIEGVTVDVLPYYFAPSIFNPYPPVERVLQPVFIGNVTGGRKLFLDALNNVLRREYSVTVKPFLAGPKEYSLLAKKYHINIDIPRKKEVNFRVFEVTGSSGLLITGSHPLVEDYYQTGGREIYSYELPNLNLLESRRDEGLLRELDAAARRVAEIIGGLLDDPESAVRTALAGCLRAWREHTVQHRACKIVEDLGFKCDRSYLRALERMGENACRESLDPGLVKPLQRRQ